MIDGTSFLKEFKIEKQINFIRTEGTLISTKGAPINEVLIRERRERLSFSGKAGKTYDLF